MTYKEAWLELIDRLHKADIELKGMEQIASGEEKARLKAKLEGLRIAIEYMRETKADIDA